MEFVKDKAKISKTLRSVIQQLKKTKAALDAREESLKKMEESIIEREHQLEREIAEFNEELKSIMQ